MLSTVTELLSRSLMIIRPKQALVDKARFQTLEGELGSGIIQLMVEPMFEHVNPSVAWTGAQCIDGAD